MNIQKAADGAVGPHARPAPTEPELASAVVYLMSEAAGFITGALIRVDGGVPTARHTWDLQPAEKSFVYDGFAQYQRPVTLMDHGMSEPTTSDHVIPGRKS